MERKLYSSLDVTKFLMAIAILLSHTQNDLATSASSIVHNLLAVSDFGVPFFFACSGFLFFTKLFVLDENAQRQYYRHFSLRLGKMYLVWTIIYTTFRLTSWLVYGVSHREVMHFIHELIVRTSYPTLWFLPALWIGVSIIYFLYQRWNNKVLLTTVILLYLLCSIGDSYHNLFSSFPLFQSIWDWYNAIFLSFRNGVFMGAPFVACGYFAAHMKEMQSNKMICLLLTIVFALLFVVEAFIIKRYHLSVSVNCGLFLLPATYFLMQYLLKVEIDNKTIYRHMRNLSMLIYLSQRLVITAIPSVCHPFRDFLMNSNPYMTIILVAVLVFSISWIIEQLSKKYNYLKVLW